MTELADLGQRISEGIFCGSSVFRFAFLLDKTLLNPQEPPGTKAWVLLWDVCITHTSRETLAELRSRLPHVRVTFLLLGSTSHTQPCDISRTHALKAGLTRAAASHLVSSLIMNPDAAVVLKHSSVELKRTSLGCTQPWRRYQQKHTTTQPGHTSSVRRRLGLSTYSGANTPCRRQPIHPTKTTFWSRIATYWRGRTRCGHGSRLDRGGRGRGR